MCITPLRQRTLKNGVEDGSWEDIADLGLPDLDPVAWAGPKCHGPHGIFSSPGSELIPFRADIVFWDSGRMPWPPSIVQI